MSATVLNIAHWARLLRIECFSTKHHMVSTWTKALKAAHGSTWNQPPPQFLPLNGFRPFL